MKILMALIFVASVTQGCSMYKAATAPPPVAVDIIKSGTTRAEVVSVFGLPKSSDLSESYRTEVYEFIDGNHGATKLRIIPYFGADFFTLGLAEVVLWPMELALLQGSEGRAVVTYDQDNRAKRVIVTKKDGTPWQTSKNTATPAQE